MKSMKIVQFSRLRHLRFPSTCKFFHPLDLGCLISNEPLPPSLSPNDNRSIKRKHDPRISIYAIRSFLQVGFVFSICSLILSGFPLTSFYLAGFFVTLYYCACSCLKYHEISFIYNYSHF